VVLQETGKLKMSLSWCLVGTGRFLTLTEVAEFATTSFTVLKLIIGGWAVGGRWRMEDGRRKKGNK